MAYYVADDCQPEIWYIRNNEPKNLTRRSELQKFYKRTAWEITYCVIGT